MGDKLIKQQVNYIDPGSEGRGIIWDFSSLKTINDAYILDYTSSPLLKDSLYIMGYNQFNKKNKNIIGDDLIVGTEHNTMYYYRIKEDSLLLLGYENPIVKLQYVKPVILMTYPLNYGTKIGSMYAAQGLYSGTEQIQTTGIVETHADAYGKLTLPNGDTLNPVLRIKTIQTIEDKLDESFIEKRLESYKWYTKGYRYPIFETIRNINVINDSILFATSFFYPPQEHLYIENDLENKKILDEMWKDTKANNKIEDNQSKNVNIKNILYCKIFPNPVISILNLDYEIMEDANISFKLYSIQGVEIKSTKAKFQKLGKYTEMIDCSSLYPNSYILKISANNQTINQIIIKK